MNISDFLAGAIKPLTDLINNVHTSTEEKLTLRNKLAEIVAAVESKVLELQKELIGAQQAVIVAEANGQSWLQRNWRPLAMLNFLVLINLDVFGVLTYRLADQVWEVITWGLSGYVIGRSAEKVAGSLKNVIK